MVQEGRINPEASPGAAAAGGADVRRDVETIKSDLAALRADLSALIGSAVNAGKVQAGDARERLSTAARSRLDQFESAYGDLNTRGREVVDRVQREIEERPLRSVGIAFVSGLLLGVIARRR